MWKEYVFSVVYTSQPEEIDHFGQDNSASTNREEVISDLSRKFGELRRSPEQTCIDIFYKVNCVFESPYPSLLPQIQSYKLHVSDLDRRIGQEAEDMFD